MTKKERTIKACRELAAKYREPEGKTFFSTVSCPLCDIHEGFYDCIGCPLADDCGEDGCVEFTTYLEAAEVARVNGCFKIPTPESAKMPIQRAFDARAAFFDKIIPILEKIPASRFTRKGWEYFDELDRSW